MVFHAPCLATNSSPLEPVLPPIDAIEVAAQNSIVLRQQGTNEDEVELKIGDEITIDIFADLGTVGASGISVFVTLPKAVFHIVDERHVRLMISEA